MSAALVNGTQLFFRGRAILRAMQGYVLTTAANMADAVITGDSAGGLATYLHIDSWAKVLQAPGRKVVGMPDSGFFPYYNGTAHFSSGMHWVFRYMNSTAGVNSRCIAAH